MKFLRISPIPGTEGPAHIGKAFDVTDDGKLSASRVGFGNYSHGEVVSVPDVCALRDYVEAQQATSYCTTYALPASTYGTRQLIVVDGLLRSSEPDMLAAVDPATYDLPRIARTQEFLKYRPGPKPLSTDYDPTPADLKAGRIKTPDEVNDDLAFAWPEIAQTARVAFSSSSAHLHLDGQEVIGRKGCRLLTPVVLPPDVNPRTGIKDAAVAAHTRLCIAGRGSFMITARGQLRPRSVIDLSLLTAGQPDFWGRVLLHSPRLTQHRPAPIILPGDHAPADVSRFKALTPGEHEAMRRHLLELEEEHRAEMAATAEAYHAARDEVEFQANDGRISKDKLRAARIAAMNHGTAILAPSATLHLDNGDIVTVAQILADPAQYVGKTCASPTEPSYGASTPDGFGRHKGKIVERGGVLGVIDYAHGDMKLHAIAFHDLEELLDFKPQIVKAESVASLHHEPAAPIGAKSTAVATLPDVVHAPDAATDAAQLIALATSGDNPGDDIIRRAGGLAIVNGATQSFTAVDAMFRKAEPVQLYAATYADCIAVKQRAEQAAAAAGLNAAWSMILPSRSVDAARLRATQGRDALAYRDKAGNLQGLDDVICHKQKAVEAMHSAGFTSVAGHMCLQTLEGKREICPHIRECGFVKRLAAKAWHSTVVSPIASIKGVVHPRLVAVAQEVDEDQEAFRRDVVELLGLEDEEPRGLSHAVVIVDSASSPMASSLSIDCEPLQNDPVFQEARGIMLAAPTAAQHEAEHDQDDPAAPSLADIRKTYVPNGFIKRIDEWVGDVEASPKMAASQALDAARQYKKRYTEGGWDAQRHRPAEFRAAFKDWLDGKAEATDAGGSLVIVTRHEPMAVQTAASITVLATQGEGSVVARKFGNTLAAEKGVRQYRQGTIASRNIVQLVPNRGNIGAALHAAEKREVAAKRRAKRAGVQEVQQETDATDPTIRCSRSLDAVARLISLLETELGAGVVVATTAQHIRTALDAHRATRTTIIPFADVSVLGLAAKPAPAFVFVVGRWFHSEERAVEIAATHNMAEAMQQISAAVVEGAKPETHRKRMNIVTERRGVSYLLKSGERVSIEGVWRWGGRTDSFDAALVDDVTAKFEILIEWVAGLEAKADCTIPVVLLTEWPLAARENGIPVNAVFDWKTGAAVREYCGSVDDERRFRTGHREKRRREDAELAEGQRIVDAIRHKGEPFAERLHPAIAALCDDQNAPAEGGDGPDVDGLTAAQRKMIEDFM